MARETGEIACREPDEGAAPASVPSAAERTRARRRRARQRVGGALLLGGALAFALMGQYYFRARRDYLWDGVAYYVVAVGLFAGLIYWLERSPKGPGAVAAWRRTLAAQRLRVGMTIAGLALALTAARATIAEPPPSSFGGYLIAWALGIILVVAAQLPAITSWPAALARWRPWLEAHAFELAALALWVLLAAFLRLWRIEQIPYPLSGDEAAMGLEARRVMAGELRNPFTVGWLSHPTLWFFGQAQVMALVGSNILGLRLLSALIGVTTVVTLYLAAREMFGLAVAQIAAALLAAYPFHIHFSRQGLNNISDAWLTPLVFFFLLRGLRRREPWSMALAGVGLGLMQYGYLGSRVVPVVVAAFLFTLALGEREFIARHARGLLALAIGAVAAGMPILFWYLRHPNDFSARLVIIGILQTGWLDAEMARTGRTAWQVLGEQLQKAFLAFHFYLDTGPHYHAPRPLLGFLPSIFFVFGVADALLHGRDRRMALLLWAIVLPLIFGGALTIGVPFAARLVVCIPAVCILLAWGIWRLSSLVGWLAARPGTWAVGLAALVTATVMISDVRFYFGEYAPKPYFSDMNTEAATVAGQYLANLKGYQAYLFGAPLMYVDHPTLRYLAGDGERFDVLEPLPPDQRPAMVTRERRLVFLFLTERLGELETVQRYFPGGETVQFSGRFRPHLLTIYRVD